MVDYDVCFDICRKHKTDFLRLDKEGFMQLVRGERKSSFWIRDVIYKGDSSVDTRDYVDQYNRIFIEETCSYLVTSVDESWNLLSDEADIEFFPHRLIGKYILPKIDINLRKIIDELKQIQVLLYHTKKIQFNCIQILRYILITMINRYDYSEEAERAQESIQSLIKYQSNLSPESLIKINGEESIRLELKQKMADLLKYQYNYLDLNQLSDVFVTLVDSNSGMVLDMEIFMQWFVDLWVDNRAIHGKINVSEEVQDVIAKEEQSLLRLFDYELVVGMVLLDLVQNTKIFNQLYPITYDNFDLFNYIKNCDIDNLSN